MTNNAEKKRNQNISTPIFFTLKILKQSLELSNSTGKLLTYHDKYYKITFIMINFFSYCNDHSVVSQSADPNLFRGTANIRIIWIQVWIYSSGLSSFVKIEPLSNHENMMMNCWVVWTQPRSVHDGNGCHNSKEPVWWGPSIKLVKICPVSYDNITPVNAECYYKVLC